MIQERRGSSEKFKGGREEPPGRDYAEFPLLTPET
jgi:hypothetical protein